MRKSLPLSAMLIAAALLSGCTTAKESSPSAVSGNSGSSVSESTSPDIVISTAEDKPDSSQAESSADTPEPDSSESPAPESGEDKQTFELTGLLGEEIKPSEISMISADSEITAEQLTADNWHSITCDTFAYVGESSGICYNSIDNSDIFDKENQSFAGVPAAAPTEYKRVQPGDQICGLTVKSARTYLTNERVMYSGADASVPGAYFSGCFVEFEGSAEMTGYIYIAPEDDYGVSAGDIFFVPAPGNDVLPVVHFWYNDDSGKVANNLYVSCTNEFYWVNEYPTFCVGNTSETSVNVSGIPVDNQYHKAKITVDNLSVSSIADWISTMTCELTDLEAL